MLPRHLPLCDICREVAASLEMLKALTANGIILCRGTKQSIKESGCALRKISWDCIDEYNSKWESEGDLLHYLTDLDPRVYLRGWNGPETEGKEWYDIDQLQLEYLRDQKEGTSFAPLETFDVYTSPDDPAAKYITTGAVDLVVDSEGNYEQVQRWLAKCKESHADCPKPRKRLLPTRVVDVGPRDGSQDPKIHVNQGERDYYLVLSYCWGGPQPITLTQDTEYEKTQGIGMSALPRTLHDAVIITRSLGLRYIWIDALCIIQDSPKDKENELKKMAQIYQHGLLTISAASAKTVHDGFLQERKAPVMKFSPFILSYCSPDSTTSEPRNIIVQESHRYDARSEPINQRAWTLQERLLSQRVLVYSTSQLIWQCQTEQLRNGGVARNFFNPSSERFDAAFFTDKVSSPQSPISARNLTYNWIDTIIDYTHCSLTFGDDKLIAIAGIASEFQRLRAGDTYLAGMWRSTLIMELMWMVEPSREVRALH